MRINNNFSKLNFGKIYTIVGVPSSKQKKLKEAVKNRINKDAEIFDVTKFFKRKDYENSLIYLSECRFDKDYDTMRKVNHFFYEVKHGQKINVILTGKDAEEIKKQERENSEYTTLADVIALGASKGISINYIPKGRKISDINPVIYQIKNYENEAQEEN